MARQIVSKLFTSILITALAVKFIDSMPLAVIFVAVPLLTIWFSKLRLLNPFLITASVVALLGVVLFVPTQLNDRFYAIMSIILVLSLAQAIIFLGVANEKKEDNI